MQLEPLAQHCDLLDELDAEFLSRLNGGGASDYRERLDRDKTVAEQKGFYKALLPMMVSANAALSLEPPPFLVDGLIPAQSFTVLYGREATYKSFLALDMVMSIATGKPFFHFKTVSGPALYIFSEGTSSLGLRIEAWVKHYDRKHFLPECPAFFIPQALPLNTESGFLSLRLALQRIPVAPKIVVIDTLNTCTLGADENTTDGLSTLLSVINWIRYNLGAAVLVLHHARKGGDTLRGSTSIPGAADCVMKMTKTDYGVSCACEKMKDGSPFETLTFAPTVVPLPPKRNLASPSSLILELRGDGAPSADTLTDKLLAALPADPVPWGIWRARCAVEGITAKQFERARQKLLDRGSVVANGNTKPITYSRELTL